MLSKRQKRYREYLKGEHWSTLRASALARDNNKCRCGSTDRLQVHHINYRVRLEDCVLSDVQTLCRKCHRLEHGLGPEDWETKQRQVERHFNYLKRPTVEEWKDFYSLVKHSGSLDALDAFSETMFRFVLHVVAHEQESGVVNWWMNEEKKRFWFSRAYNVRESIQERI